MVQLRGEGSLSLYSMDVTGEENQILDLTLTLTTHSQSKTQDLEPEVIWFKNLPCGTSISKGSVVLRC
jgi:hypothetical protein